MKILIAGDIHMNTHHVKYLIDKAKANKCELILNVGDFGYWPHIQNGRSFLSLTNTWLEEAGLDLFWIDGNHENFDEIGAHTSADHMCFISDQYSRIRYIPRGLVWEWDGVKFLGMGGAISIDRDWRQQHEKDTNKPRSCYWPEEAIEESDIQRAISAVGKTGCIVCGTTHEDESLDHEHEAFVEVLICHDAPNYVNIPLHGFNVRDKAFDFQTKINRMRLDNLVEETRPRIIFHGHYHFKHDIPYSRPGLTIPCFGLGCDWLCSLIASPSWIPMK